MIYRETKVYSDGSHYIAIPHTTRPQGRKKPIIENEISEERKDLTQLENNSEQAICEKCTLTKKEKFEEIYAESKQLPKRERKEYIQEQMRPQFEDEKALTEFVNKNIERKRTNSIARKVRLMRKVNLQDFNYFCTFTYDDTLHNEESFRRKLSNCIRHLSSRKGWKYIGVWERSPSKQRLHFHGLFYIPENAMTGELKQVSDYSTKSHKRQTIYQNTYFETRFGRNDFKKVDKQEIGQCVAYLIKYLEKSGEKLVYSRGLPTYFISDIKDDDVICTIGQEDKKLLLFDDFTCLDEGCYVGTVSPETISKLRKSN